MDTIDPGSTVTQRLWVERLMLSNFRNYASANLQFGPSPVVLVGQNGAGKTNLMEAVSLLAAGQGLRQAAYADLVRSPGADGWSVAATLQTTTGPVDIGTGLAPGGAQGGRQGRIVRVNGETQSGTGSLADLVEMVWLTPAMDGLFAGPASERRRFLDRLILCFDPRYRTRLGHYERAMQSRNRILADGVTDRTRFEGFERVMAETGVAIAAARLEAVGQLSTTIEQRRQRNPNSPFPWASLAIEGTIEVELANHAAVDVEEIFAEQLASTRERDRAAGRTLSGPHRSDLVVGHGPKDMPSRQCSTGEQKALLVGFVLAHAELTGQHRDGVRPILLLDEIAAHLDPSRRVVLYDEILRLGVQAWMTGTDLAPFESLFDRAQIFRVDEGRLEAISRRAAE
jgi:DNA replication and repair protein RecF